MAKTEKRWQLLLVADDGRIIPFKRIKSVAVGVVVLLVFLGLFCAGLAWQLTAEKVRHQRTQARLAEADRQVTHFKREHELIAAELVLAEARMEKAGLPVPRRQERIPQQKAAQPADSQATDSEAGGKTSPPPPAEPPGETKTPVQAAGSVSSAPEAAADKTPTAETSSAATKPDTEASVVAISDLEMEHDTAKKVLMARFRINNDGPPSSPIAGQCVVVLKNESEDRDTWQAMPEVRLTDGSPDGKGGRSFRISRFIDMEILAPVQGDPSSFTTATVYVFDPSGTELLAKDFPIDLPAPAPLPTAKAAAQPDTDTASDSVPEAPMVDVQDLKLVHDADQRMLLARFRVSNTGSDGTSVAGRCVVVLHDPQLSPEAWLAMPGVVLVNGEPDGTRGQAFKISRFRDMEIKAMGQIDSSAFSVASIYVFDTSGAQLLQKDFAVDLPAPETKPEAPGVVAPASQSTEAAPADQLSDAPSSDEGPRSTATPPSADRPPDQPANWVSPTIPAGTPTGDPSLTDDAQPTKQPDSRARF